MQENQDCALRAPLPVGQDDWALQIYRPMLRKINLFHYKETKWSQLWAPNVKSTNMFALSSDSLTAWADPGIFKGGGGRAITKFSEFYIKKRNLAP